MNDHLLNAKLQREADIDAWVEYNKDSILESYIDKLDLEDIPEEYARYVPTDDVDDWEVAFEKWTEKLTIDDVPDEFITDAYDSLEGRNYGDYEE